MLLSHLFQLYIFQTFRVYTKSFRLLSNLLRLPITPTRNGILKELVRLNIPEIANENARSLYRLVTVLFIIFWQVTFVTFTAYIYLQFE